MLLTVLYLPVCIKGEGSKGWADIEDRRYINGGLTFRFKSMDCKKSYKHRQCHIG